MKQRLYTEHMNKAVFLPVILGTNRQERQSEHAAKVIFNYMQKDPRIETVLIDVRDFELPHDNYGRAIQDLHPMYKDTIERADGLVIVSPEYNHGYPGILKSVMDTLFKEYFDKPVSLVGVSEGPWGGVRVIEALLPFVRALHLLALNNDLQFPNAPDLFDSAGHLRDPAPYEKRLEKFTSELVRMAIVLRAARSEA